ncbi:dehydrogenase E1 component subunit alpha/beta [Conexibacter sp. CPCC 206217]|uniref:alpha-ketoacid dehydrogenase subunit alpha/beta n=1 Tax=Conexibacter sp. CPCC 206217 TaxID=3064574 RepID=UPI002720B1CF|nr:dehydrogenase E1 component subunit alpha/beta [Conexibacter sp. CPCC 206217]MDO8210095.1 dehydrogenase E1 component subunit alpha/beta [Conexibacter sp. CPCC 206217]
MSSATIPPLTADRPADRPPLIDHYRQMLRIRYFEDRATELFVDGQIVGTAHSCAGQEAIAVGAAAVMRASDYLIGHHRSHGHLMARGADIRRMMAEMFGKRTGFCKGLGGSMHIADLELDILGCNGIVGAGLPHACGAALTASYRDTDHAAVAFFGDGAAGQGAAHEAMNLAATWKLPVVFICENNQFALSADWTTTRAVADLADRAPGYGMAGEVVDGNDVVAVENAVERALERARAGDGPTLLEMKTFRRMQHSMRANLPDVRDMELVASWERNDPIPRLETALRERGELDDALHERLVAEIRAEVDTAVDTAAADEDASADDLLSSVYSPHQRHPAPPRRSDDRTLGFVDAIREAMDLELEADPDVLVIGEDVGRVGGIFRATAGLYERHGARRVRDTPLTESGFVGCGIGAALTGLRPIVELQFSDFSAVAFDQLVNQAAKLKFMMGGGPAIPLVIRMVSGGGVRLGAQHSQSLESVFAHFPGLVVLMPSNAYDAKGLLAAAVRDDNPVVFLEQKQLMFANPEPVPEARYSLDIGSAAVVREGSDVTVVALGAMVPAALRSARELEKQGVSVEVIDPRTIVPLDRETILASVRKTSRLVVAHEAVTFGGFGGEIAALVAAEAFWDLDAPVVRVGAPFHPVPYQKDLERQTLPDAADITAAIQSLQQN